MTAVIRGAHRRAVEAHNGRAWLAWHVAVLPRAKRMPPLSKLQVQMRPKRQTWREQMAICEAIARAYAPRGGTAPRAEKRARGGKAP